MVDIRALLAVHLHIDEQLVHQGGGCFILEALMRHDVAPVAGGIANGEQDRLALGARAVQSGAPPGHPMHGIVLVLQKIGAGFLCQKIAAHLWPFPPAVPGIGLISAWLSQS